LPQVPADTMIDRAPPRRRCRGRQEEMAMSTASTHAPQDAGASRVLAGGFFALQIGLGYEWLMSGLSKVGAGDFPDRLGGVLSGLTSGQSGPFKSFVDSVVIPNGSLFGYLVMLGELAVGIVLIVTSLVYLARSSRLGPRALALLALLAGLACLGGAAMSLNYHLTTGATPPWAISPDPYAPGVDIDSLLVILQLVMAVCYAALLLSLRRRARGAG
jgi:uncharacterized membrane protein YphA (DoxX/SURF4 family)